MSVGIAYAREGSIGWGGVPGSRGGGRHWLGFIVGLVVLALLAAASVVLTPTALMPAAAGVAAASREAVAAGPVPAAQALGLPQAGVTGSAGLSPAGREDALDAYGKLPLSFVPNAGQTDQSVRYYAQGSGFSFFFTQDKAVLSFAKGERGHALELQFLGSSPDARLEAGDSAPGTVNYLTAGASHTNLATYQQLTYRELWPGIDMVFRGQGGELKYEFHLRPGANPDDVRLGYAGADGLSVSSDGALLVDTPLGALRDSSPTSYQLIDGRQVSVESSYALTGHSYGFTLGSYDRGQPLVIDPGLEYSTYLGGVDTDSGFGIAVDTAGNAYVAGATRSADFPTTPGVFDATSNGSTDAFVTKLNPTGTALVYSTYLGGTSIDNAQAIAVDTTGNAYLTGMTFSFDFPTTPGALDTSLGGGRDAYVTKLNPAGTGLVYSTYLGGDAGFGIAVDTTGNAYVTGETLFDFPTTGGAFDTTPNGGVDAFVAKLNLAGSGLVYSTLLGGTNSETAQAIALDAAGSAYVTGQTISTDFPTTPGAFDTTLDGQDEVFVTKLATTGSTLLYSTYLGGTSGGGLEAGFGIAVDATGSAYVTGTTDSTDFPTTTGAFDTSSNGSGDAFVTKLNLTGTALDYSTYLGGGSIDQARGIALDATGNAYVTGFTLSGNFPTTTGAFDTSSNGDFDAFVTKLNAAGTALDYSTFLGGASDDRGHGIALDTSGNAYVTGLTLSADFPTTTGAFDTSSNGVEDAFVTKLAPVAAVNQPPTAVDDSYSTAEDTTLTETAPGVLGNDTDPDSDPLTAVLVSGPGNGTLTLNADGSFSYTPAANFNGTDTFTYKANDGTTDSNTATVTITVTPVNDAPTAVDDSYSTAEDTTLTETAPGVLGNDTDPDSDPLTAVLVSGPDNGTLTLNADGSFSYTPAANFNGTDTFTYNANDGTTDSNTATVTITVTPVNDAPTVTVAAGGSCAANSRSGTMNLTVADVDDPAASLVLSASSSNTALVPNANVVFGGSGAARTVTATAVSGQTGTATLTVTVSDGNAQGTVQVTVKAAGNGNNTVTGTAGADMLFAQNGNDSVNGLGGNDLLCGGRGNDTLTGGTGADHFSGGPGTDTATDFNAGEGDSTDGT